MLESHRPAPTSLNIDSRIQKDLRRRISRYAVVSPNLRRCIFKCILKMRYASQLLRYDRRKSPTPSYLSCLFTLAARGVYVDLRLEYVNQQDMPIHEHTYARRSKLRRLRKEFSDVKINHQKHVAANVKYGRQDSRRISRRLRRLREPIQNGAGRRLCSRRKH